MTRTPGISLLYDSLSSGSRDVSVEEGSYILAIGQPGDTFELNGVK